MRRVRLVATIGLTLLLPAIVFAATEHAVILVMDGARYTETLGDTTYANVPHIAELMTQGTMLTHFRTAALGSIAESWTETCPGHARLTTGTYQNIANNGSELPSVPGMFQYYREQTGSPQSSGWVLCSKDKLDILANTSASQWHNQYQPSMNCGVNGDGTGGYREDSITHELVKEKLTTDHPRLMIINYKGPDSMGHLGNWSGYLAAIREVDGYVNDVWNTIQADSVMRNKTALFITNDHGRHTTDFTSHNDACSGCRTIMCVVLGPDIKSGFVDTTMREQIDVAPTIAALMGFEVPTAEGNVMSEMFKSPTAVSSRQAPAMVFSDSRRIGVTSGVGRQVFFSNVPTGCFIDIVTMTGSRIARVNAGLSAAGAVWDGTTSAGRRAGAGHYVAVVNGAGGEPMPVRFEVHR